MTEIITHEAYIKACADALEAAGIDNTDWTAEDDSPRTGSVTLAPAATAFTYDGDTAALLWDEERGWALAWGAPDQGHHDVVADLYTGVLPAPSMLVGYVRTALAVKPTADGSTGRYRSARDVGEFDALLAAYAVA